MAPSQTEALQDLVQHIKAPVSRRTIDEKVELFERRLNGKTLPFLGLHGTLLTLIYLINQGATSSHPIEFYPWFGLVALSVMAFICGGITFFYHIRGRAQDVPGSAALTCALAMLASMYLPLTEFYLVIPLTICLALLALNAAGYLPDYEFNTLWLYLPPLYLILFGLTAIEQLIAALVLYGPAIYVKFKRQPAANKLPFGFSLLLFLGFIVKDKAQSEVLVGILVLLALLLFLAYSFRMRHQIGSSYRHFLGDAIVTGLWALLVELMMDLDSDTGWIVWGFGVAAYQCIALVILVRHKYPEEDNHPTNDDSLGNPSSDENARSFNILEWREKEHSERDARLAWLQIAAVAMLGDFIINDILDRHFGIDGIQMGLLIIVLPFIPVFYRLKAPFLALSTRLWIAGCLFGTATATQENLENRYGPSVGDEDLEGLHNAFLAAWAGELALPFFTFMVALAASLRFTPAYRVAWWRGLVRPRHMVLLRRTQRLILTNANRIAFIGGFISAAAALLDWMRYAGSSSQRSRDLLLLGTHVFAVFITVLFLRYWLDCCDDEYYRLLTSSPLSFANGDLSFVIAWCLWGTMLYLNGVLTRDYLARFFASAFVVMPLATFSINNISQDGNLDKVFLALVMLICCFTFFGFGLLRRLAG